MSVGQALEQYSGLFSGPRGAPPPLQLVMMLEDFLLRLLSVELPVMCNLALGMDLSQRLTDRGHKMLPLPQPCSQGTNCGAVSIPVIPVDRAGAGLYLRLPASWVSLPVLLPLSSPEEYFPSSPMHYTPLIPHLRLGY